jgi:hypothetical protein
VIQQTNLQDGHTRDLFLHDVVVHVDDNEVDEVVHDDDHHRKMNGHQKMNDHHHQRMNDHQKMKNDVRVLLLVDSFPNPFLILSHNEGMVTCCLINFLKNNQNQMMMNQKKTMKRNQKMKKTNQMMKKN